MKTKVIRIYAAALMVHQDPHALELDPKYKTLRPKEEDLEEITGDLAAEFPKWPVPEAHFRKAMQDLLDAVVDRMTKRGLLK